MLNLNNWNLLNYNSVTVLQLHWKYKFLCFTHQKFSLNDTRCFNIIFFIYVKSSIDFIAQPQMNQLSNWFSHPIAVHWIFCYFMQHLILFMHNFQYLVVHSFHSKLKVLILWHQNKNLFSILVWMKHFFSKFC